MRVILGLGNPDKKYQKTRHNIGFRVVEEFAKENNFSSFRASKKIRAEIAEGMFDNEKIILAKPQTFMNLSGKSAKLLVAYSHSPIANFCVIHDDIDLPLGKIRISRSRGAAGHKGVESIIKELGTKNFVRFRIGIMPKSGKPKNLEKFVLQKPRGAKPIEGGDETKSQRPFNKEEAKIVREVIKKTMQAIEMALREGTEKAMSRYNC